MRKLRRVNRPQAVCSGGLKASVPYRLNSNLLSGAGGGREKNPKKLQYCLIPLQLVATDDELKKLANREIT